ncbi:MAG: hypothetical protein ACOYLD_06120 [Anaerohalosphaeraceae bacterium]|jgi:predicted anti-sigma-YlaC factor YlaD
MFCTVYRWTISNTFDNNRQLPAACRRHLMRCDGCRSFFTSSLALGERLSLEAAMTQPALPARLGHEIAATIGHPVAENWRRPAAHWPWVAAACAAVALLPIVFLAASYLRNEHRDEAIPPPTSLSALLGTDSARVDRLAESVGGLLERPLAVEVETLQNQTRSFVRFLMSCSGADMSLNHQAMQTPLQDRRENL